MFRDSASFFGNVDEACNIFHSCGLMPLPVSSSWLVDQRGTAILSHYKACRTDSLLTGAILLYCTELCFVCVACVFPGDEAVRVALSRWSYAPELRLMLSSTRCFPFPIFAGPKREQPVLDMAEYQEYQSYGTAHTPTYYFPYTRRLLRHHYRRLCFVKCILHTGKTLPQWLSEKKRRSLSKDVDYRRRIELLQDFDFPTASQKVCVSQDGQFVIVAGTYPPQIKGEILLSFGCRCLVVSRACVHPSQAFDFWG